MIEEYWTSPEDLQSHLRSSDYQRVLLVVEMAKGHPEIKFEEVVRTAGFETIAEDSEPPRSDWHRRTARVSCFDWCDSARVTQATM